MTVSSDMKVDSRIFTRYCAFCVCGYRLAISAYPSIDSKLPTELLRQFEPPARVQAQSAQAMKSTTHDTPAHTSLQLYMWKHMYLNQLDECCSHCVQGKEQHDSMTATPPIMEQYPLPRYTLDIHFGNHTETIHATGSQTANQCIIIYDDKSPIKAVIEKAYYIDKAKQLMNDMTGQIINTQIQAVSIKSTKVPTSTQERLVGLTCEECGKWCKSKAGLVAHHRVHDSDSVALCAIGCDVDFLVHQPMIISYRGICFPQSAKAVIGLGLSAVTVSDLCLLAIVGSLHNFSVGERGEFVCKNTKGLDRKTVKRVDKLLFNNLIASPQIEASSGQGRLN
ncbi:hypothetical protein CLF_112080 [Clonorchis sinensis]|uniref:C2H2-type domain-containing protein n=1 Tax=Clonorchis sinensis TaxID=79923 RepID=G7YVT4_CLOSI|nr:hypothetical protein CLF_112080 [Clonorchis sinensis]